VDPLARGGLGQVEVLGDLGNVAVADAAEADGLSLEGGRDRAAGPLLPDGLSGLLHGALLASILANLSVHEIEAGSTSFARSIPDPSRASLSEHPGEYLQCHQDRNTSHHRGHVRPQPVLALTEVDGDEGQRP
jgi:hypothetical protein